MPLPKYIVRLTEEERTELEDLRDCRKSALFKIKLLLR